MAVSPLCDRQTDVDVAKSQVGFFSFICMPFYTPSSKFYGRSSTWRCRSSPLDYSVVATHKTSTRAVAGVTRTCCPYRG